MATPTPTITSGYYGRRQETQDLPFWLSASYTTLVNPANPTGAPITTVAIVNLPLTYYGPSIPLGPGWVWGGSASPASIYIPPTATETGEITTTTAGPTTISHSTTASVSASASLSSATATATTSSLSSLSASASSATESTSSLATTSSPSITTTPATSTESLTSISPSSSSSVSPATLPPGGKHLALPTGAIVGIVVGGILALVLCCILAACCRRRRDYRSSYRRSDPRDPEVQAGVAEQSSLLSGRLAGGESPPIGSPTMAGGILRSGRRTPLSTRRPQYETVPTALGSSETADQHGTIEEAEEPIEPSRASTDEVHPNGYSAVATGAAVGAVAGAATARSHSRSRAPPEIRTSNLQTSSSGSTSPRSRLGSMVTPIAGSFLNFFGRRGRNQERLGEGWEEVVPPTRQQAMGLGMARPPTPPRYTDSPLQPFPPNDSLNSSRPSQRVEVLNSTYTTQDRDPSMISSHSEYVDARSRPQTPGSGLGVGAIGVALGDPEMRERNVSLVSRRSEQPVPPLPLQGYQPVSAVPPHLRSSLHTVASGNPFENSAYVADPQAYDALDSLPPAGLLAAAAAGDQRARWTRSAIEEEPAAGAALLGGTLDDEPPAPARSFSRATGEQELTVPPVDRSGLYTPSLHASVGPDERESFDDRSGGRPWSGQVVRAESVSLGQRVPASRPIWTQSLATHTTGPSPVATTSQQPFPPVGVPLMPPPPARQSSGARISRGSRDWTTQLDSPSFPADDYRAIVNWFEQNPTPGRTGSLVVPANLQEQEPSDESSSLGRARSDAEQDMRRLSNPREADIQPPRPHSS